MPLSTTRPEERTAIRSACRTVADALQARGLVERTPDPTDRRAVVLTPTDEGRRVQQEIAAARATDTRDLFSRLDADERAALAGLLRTLAD